MTRRPAVAAAGLAGRLLILALLTVGIPAVSDSARAVAGGAGRGGGWAGGPGWARSGFYGADGGINRGAIAPAAGWRPAVESPLRPSLEAPAPRLGPQPLDPAAPGSAARNPVTVNPWAVQPSWVRSGWAQARPWTWGWYGPDTVSGWAWWPAASAQWGGPGLAAAAALQTAVDQAIAAQQPTIAVPGSGGQLLLVYGSLLPTGADHVSFLADGAGGSYAVVANCRSGLLNGLPPATSALAQLLNAACSVAFGPA